MKTKIYKIIVFFLVAVLASVTLISVMLAVINPTADPVYLAIDGDIAGGYCTIDLAKTEKVSYTYTEDEAEAWGEGWNLNDALAKVSPTYTHNKLMMTATDGISALIEYPLTGTVYIYQDGDGKLCAKGIDYPKVTGLKDISEITIITSDTATDGYKILSQNTTEMISRGNAKLKLFDFVVENKLGDNTADKYRVAADRSVSGFTGKNKNIVYYEDYDIEKNASLASLNWVTGKLVCQYGDRAKSVFGFATGTDKLILDAFYDMKTALDAGKKVMLILPDGFSWEQANTFGDDLTTLKLGENSVMAASTHLSISPVALAAMVTGRSPYSNGVHFDEGESRAVLCPNVDDIFKYAVDNGKFVAYLEGSGNLILTSVTPQYSTSDYLTYQKASQAIQAGTDLIFAHFHETDDTNHAYGPLSSEAKTKLLITESYIGNLMAEFDGVVIVVPDHGHNTLYDEDGNAYGKHGMFTALDMYVPYYIFEV